MSNYFSKRYIPRCNQVRLCFFRSESDCANGFPPIYSVSIDKYAPWFVYFHLARYVQRYYNRGLMPFWVFPFGACPCTNIRKINSMTYMDFVAY